MLFTSDALDSLLPPAEAGAARKSGAQLLRSRTAHRQGDQLSETPGLPALQSADGLWNDTPCKGAVGSSRAAAVRCCPDRTHRHVFHQASSHCFSQSVHSMISARRRVPLVPAAPPRPKPACRRVPSQRVLGSLLSASFTSRSRLRRHPFKGRASRSFQAAAPQPKLVCRHPSLPGRVLRRSLPLPDRSRFAFAPFAGSHAPSAHSALAEAVASLPSVAQGPLRALASRQPKPPLPVLSLQGGPSKHPLLQPKLSEPLLFRAGRQVIARARYRSSSRQPISQLQPLRPLQHGRGRAVSLSRAVVALNSDSGTPFATVAGSSGPTSARRGPPSLHMPKPARCRFYARPASAGDLHPDMSR